MNKSEAKTISLMGVLGALEFIILFLETYVFTVLIPLAPPCFLSLSVAITLSLVNGKKGMFIGGTLLGFCSFVIAIIIGNPVFILPWVSILPRIFIGVVAYFVSSIFIHLFRNSNNNFIKNYLPYSIGAVFGVITNTVLVLFMMLVLKFIGMEEVIATFMAINFPIEVCASAVIVPVLVNAIKRIRRD